MNCNCQRPFLRKMPASRWQHIVAGHAHHACKPPAATYSLQEAADESCSARPPPCHHREPGGRGWAAAAPCPQEPSGQRLTRLGDIANSVPTSFAVYTVTTVPPTFGPGDCPLKGLQGGTLPAPTSLHFLFLFFFAPATRCARWLERPYHPYSCMKLPCAQSRRLACWACKGLMWIVCTP